MTPKPDFPDPHTDQGLDPLLPRSERLVASAALQSILRSLGTAPNFRDCMRACALTLHQSTHADGATIYRMSKQGHQLEQIHSVGFPREFTRSSQHIDLHDSLTGQAILERQLILSAEAGQDERIPEPFRQQLADSGFKSVASLPLLMHGDVVGAITLGWRRRVRLNADEQRLLMDIGYGIAIAVEHDLREFESTRDALTGLRNRRDFDAQLPELIRACVATGTPISLAMLDLDDFKSCNDTHGHLMGDEILKTLASLITSHMLMERGDGFRIGGEEFVIVLPGLAALDAHSLIDEIRGELMRCEFSARNGERFHISLSAGIAEYDAGARESLSALFSRADQAMYAAKAQGKNRVIVAETERRDE